jgi:exodeoxyribonuclease V alpha subunit
MAYQTVAAQLGLTQDLIRQGLELLSRPRTVRRRGKIEERRPLVIQEDGKFFLSRLHAAEKVIAQHIRRLQSAQLADLAIPADVFGILTPDESQRAALELAAHESVLVTTGGPGVGKTTVAKAMLRLYESAGLGVVCCAPTGKAAIRMTQQTGCPASTIHSMLKMRPGTPPQHNELKPIAAQVVVVDESSMIDVELFASLLAAIPTGARLLIIGDVDQLPSIGAGRVLFDLITSQALPVVRLTKIHRQASESRIPYVARDVNAGRCPDLTVRGSDFTHWECSDEQKLADRIVESVASEIPARKGIPSHEIQVIAAQYDEGKDSSIGIVALNRLLQGRLNPADSAEFDVVIGRSYPARTNDRVIQTSNNYDLGVMNGEMGRVILADPDGIALSTHATVNVPTLGEVEIDWSGKYPSAKAGESAPVDAGTPRGIDVVDGKPTFKDPRVLVVDFGDKRIAYTSSEAKKLELGYCISVHKSQGSQFKAVVLVVHNRHAFSLTRALCYTAVTRAEKFCLTVGSAAQLERSARNTRGIERKTMLQQRLREAPIPLHAITAAVNVVVDPVVPQADPAVDSAASQS